MKNSKLVFGLFISLVTIYLVSCSKSELAEVETSEVTDITMTSAVSGGVVISDGGEDVVERGLVWCTEENPTININVNYVTKGTGTGEFVVEIINLEPNTTYFIRAYAKNSEGIAYGENQSFTTKQFPKPAPCEGAETVTDIHGNSYNTVMINDQCWMVENLRVHKYNNGEDIPNVTDDSEWAGMQSPAYCAYDNSSSTADTYGYLYNWFAVETGNLCPDGWRVPTDTEWNQMIEYLGGEFVAGGILKQSGTNLWESPNEGATNEVGFNAIPGGDRNDVSGEFTNLETGAYFWTYPETVGSKAWSKAIQHDHAIIYTGYQSKQFGFSVRCIKNN